jgi:hypothetical protein
MSLASSSDPRASVRYATEGLALGIAAALLALALGLLAPPAFAQKDRASSDRATLDVVTEEGDTLPVVREVIITRDGISIDAKSGNVVGRIEDYSGGDRITVDLDIGDDEPVIRMHRRGGPGEIVSFFRNVEIPAEKVVNGEVVALFGDVRINGEVHGDVVAVMGTITLGDSARIGGDVVAIGGIDASPSALTHGDLVSIPIFLGFPVFSPWAMWTSFFIGVILFSILGALVAALFPDRLRRVADTGSQRTLLSLLVGAASFPLLTVAFALLLLTVIGIPVAMLIVLLYPVAAFVGYVAGCALLGARLRGQGIGDAPLWQAAVLGIVFIGIFYIVGGVLMSLGEAGAGLVRAIGLGIVTVGVLLASITSLLGMGALFVSKLGEPERPRQAAVPPAPGAPPAAPAAPAPPPPVPPTG